MCISATPIAAASSSAKRQLEPSDANAVPTIGTGGSSTLGANADDAIDVDLENDGQPPAKQQKKCTSDVWQYFNKYTISVKENGKQLSSCGHNASSKVAITRLARLELRATEELWGFGLI